MKLTNQVYWNLVEAVRRFTRFGKTYRKPTLTGAWTGLGFKSDYQETVDKGYMVLDGQKEFNFRSMAWLRLTPKGAEIVQRWLDQGFSYKNIEAGEYPDRKIEP